MTASEQLITLTADIVSSHLANNNVSVNDVPNLIQQVHSALSGLGAPVEEVPQEKVPVVSVRSSVKPDHIVCMECGKKQKTLKRHLQTAHRMTPDQYRKDYGLPQSYPMVAPDYAERRRSLAHSIGLGRRKVEEPTPGSAQDETPPKSSRRGRKAEAASDERTAVPKPRRRRSKGPAEEK